MSIRGVGDRWLADERIDGVAFGHHARVSVASGQRAGAYGTVRLLLALSPEPTYLVELDDQAGDLRARQSTLHALA